MCGIVGYVGPREVFPVLVGGLEKLEYRGYDSAGVAQIDGNKFSIHRAEGKLSRLKEILDKQGKLARNDNNGKVNIGMGHTRWATHGKPSETNAHPHVAGNVCVVHNGIIENYVELRTRLQKEGCTFVSETDTEIAAHLINSLLPKHKTLLETVKAALKELHGSYALVVMAINDPQTLVITKNSTPVIVGLSEGENFIASDIPAILEYTRNVLILEDGEIAEIKKDSVYLERDGVEVTRKPTHITWDAITAEKGGFRHFMLKEIYEQPQVITETFRGRIDQEKGTVFLDDVSFSDDELKKIKRINIVACGTAYYAGLVTKFYLEKFAKINVEVDYGSEFRYRAPVIDGDTLFMVISQSGETADTLGSLQLAAELKAKTLAICNVVGSSIARKAGNVLYTHAGPEISVASTKAFVTQLTAGYLLALKLGLSRGTLTPAESKKLMDELVHLPSLVREVLGLDKKIEEVAKKHAKSHNFLFIGRGFLYPIALEGALKLKEISYIHAEGYPAGELKHGPIALVNEETPVVVIFGRDGQNYEKTMSNLMEVNARGGKIIAVTDTATEELKKLASDIIEVGTCPSNMLPIALTVPLQLLAYHVAVSRGTDVDQPRNLAKSVTVE